MKQEKKMSVEGKAKPAEQQSIIIGESGDKDKEKKEEASKNIAARDREETSNTEPKKTSEEEREGRKREDEQEFLRRIGFKEHRKDDRIQFVKRIKDDEVIGMTYNSNSPNGRFWGFHGDKPMSTNDLKEKEEVKQFYAFRRGEIEMPKSELPATPPKQGIQEAQGMEFKLKKGRMYRVGDHEEPDSGLAQQWGNQAKISLRVMEPTEQTSDYAKAVVRATLPDGQYIEECIIHYFEVSKERIVFETIEKMLEEKKKPIEGFDDEGRPILTAEAKYRAYRRFIKFKDFAIRDAITKAGRRAILKLLNREWREPEEIEAEEQEVRRCR